MSQTTKIAGVQMDVAYAEPRRNLECMAEKLREAADAGAALTVFPECSLTGYCFESLQEAEPLAETVPGRATEFLTDACQRFGQHCVFGMLERDGDCIYNACVLVGPAGVVGSYRKIHLPFLGVDRFTTPGNRPFAVHSAGSVKVGMSICYDGSFPESGRILALAGADLIVLPTNWPRGAQCTAQFVVNTRALENHVYFMAVNRIGVEKGTTFIGQSRICGPHGEVLASADEGTPTILYADIDPTRARDKHIVKIPGEYEIDRWRDRRPEMYGPIVKSVH